MNLIFKQANHGGRVIIDSKSIKSVSEYCDGVIVIDTIHGCYYFKCTIDIYVQKIKESISTVDYCDFIEF